MQRIFKVVFLAVNKRKEYYIMDSFGIIAVIILLAPTIFFIALTCVLFNKGEEIRLKNNIVDKPNTSILYFYLIFDAILLLLNSIVISTSNSGLADIAWFLTVVWILFSWIPILISLNKTKTKGLKYRKWFIIIWVLNFLIFLTGIMNPIPQSV